MPPARRVDHRVTTRPVTMEEKAVLILAQLKRGARIRFSELLQDFKERSHGVMTFLAGLELTRRRVLFLRQSRPFTELWLYRREEGEGGEEVELTEGDGALDDDTGEDPA